jgi:hypothetical protein
MLGSAVGRALGTLDGTMLGTPVGTELDSADGTADGIALGSADGATLGAVDGRTDGTGEGRPRWRPRPGGNVVGRPIGGGPFGLFSVPPPGIGCAAWCPGAAASVGVARARMPAAVSSACVRRFIQGPP